MTQFKLTFLLAVLMSMVGTKALAFDANINGIYYNFSGTEATVTYKEVNFNNQYAYSGNVVIPESVTYNGIAYSVTSIGDGAFNYCNSLTSIDIPNSVKSIGNGAFSNCSGLTSIDIPNSVTSIGDAAFSGCSGLTSIDIPNSVINIGNDAFRYCSSLTSVIIPNSVTSISSGIFQNCTSLISFSIPNSVTSIGDNAFWFCSGLTSIIIGNNVQTIGNDAFRGCSGLTSIDIPNSVTSIGNSAFYGSGLTSIDIPNSVTSIGNYAFCGSGLQSITFGNGITSISSCMFYGCTSLISVTIPNSVTSIDNGAFSGCSGLTSIDIPNSVTNIGDRAFRYCSGLTSVGIPNSVTSIGNSAFENCSGLTSVTISNSVTSIGDNAFGYCPNLKSVEFHCNEIGTWFKGLSSIEQLTIGDEVTSIGSSAFFGCSGLTSVTIGNSITNIGSNAFYDCNNLASLIIPNSVTNIGSCAFYGCSKIQSLTIPDNVMTIGTYAFPYNLKLYANKGTSALIALWNAGYNPYEIGTGYELSQPSPTLLASTQSTLTINVLPYYSDYIYKVNGEDYTGKAIEYSQLRPEEIYFVNLQVTLGDLSYTKQTYFKTQSLSPNINIKKCASSLSATGLYTEGDANVSETSIFINGTEFEGNVGILTGLIPNYSYNVKYRITVKYGENDESCYDYEKSETVKTDPLTMVTAQPKVVSAGNVIVSAQANVDDAEENVGFEWRRTDWSDDFTSNTGQAYMYEGTMEGYIRNLNTEKLWKYRPYYKSDAGTYYYGDWVGIDPTNTSYFEPTVHTYAAITVNGNTALVRGYALQGTDNITVQGFIYWKNVSGARTEDYAPALAPTIPADAQTIEADGYVMEASLTGLNYDSEYCYVAFAKTSNGETFYGELRTFTTEKDPTGIGNIRTDNTNVGEVHEVARYNMQGQRISVPERGINIIKMSDGTTRKVVVK